LCQDSKNSKAKKSRIMAYSVSIILPVINETFSLRQTIEIIESENPNFIVEYIIVICKKTTPKSLDTIKYLQDKYGNKIIRLVQKFPFLGGAIRDAFDICKGTHVIMMASDLETDPHSVKELVNLSLLSPEKIITATRWNTKGGFSGYSPIKLAFNWFFQKLFCVLYGTNLSDMTYGFRLFPSKLVKSIKWEELRHPFLFETIIKPLRTGVRIIEIPTKWQARKEGESQNNFFRNFEYFRIGIRVLFYSKMRILKDTN
jgi:glycosyltransferase involved in cell wall biosynthesis